MSVIGSDGLSVSVGDGGGPETFNILRGAQVSRFEIVQKVIDSDAVTNDAWQVGAAVSNRGVTLNCDGLMTDEAAPQRIRSLAISGLSGNFHVKLNATETLTINAFIIRYRETIQAGAIKKFNCELESNGAVIVAAG